METVTPSSVLQDELRPIRERHQKLPDIPALLQYPGRRRPGQSRKAAQTLAEVEERPRRSITSRDKGGYGTNEQFRAEMDKQIKYKEING